MNGFLLRNKLPERQQPICNNILSVSLINVVCFLFSFLVMEYPKALDLSLIMHLLSMNSA